MTAEPIHERQSLDWTAFYLHPLGGNFDLQLGTRVGHSFRALDRVSYVGGVAWAPLSFFGVEAGLRHLYRPEVATGTTHLVGIANIRLNLSIFGLMASAGWFERFTALDKALLLPTFRADVSEHDFLAAFGFWTDVIDPMRIELSLRNFDELQVNNLHNPFFQLRTYVAFQEELDLLLYGRYQVLLGFGRLDEWSVGIGLKWTPFSGDGP